MAQGCTDVPGKTVVPSGRTSGLRERLRQSLRPNALQASGKSSSCGGFSDTTDERTKALPDIQGLGVGYLGGAAP